jgi:hypothetical protein
MSGRNLEGLSERERECLAHLEEAQKLGVSFSRYCREKKLSMYQWTWIKRALVRKGVIGGRRRGPVEEPKAAGFVPVRVAPAAVAAATTTTTVCRIRHPSGWTIECASYPEVSWMSALMSGEAA